MTSEQKATIVTLIIRLSSPNKYKLCVHFFSMWWGAWNHML